MSAELHAVLRTVHIVLGAAGFVLGAAAVLLPKFSRKSFFHRWVGRSYAVSMLAMAGISVPLSIADQNVFLLVIGLLTLGWVAAGWVALRRAKKTATGRRLSPSGRLRWHVTWMGSSYIAAWTAFLVNVRPVGSDLPLMIVYSILPSIVGSILIARTTARLANPRKTKMGGPLIGN